MSAREAEPPTTSVAYRAPPARSAWQARMALWVWRHGWWSVCCAGIWAVAAAAWAWFMPIRADLAEQRALRLLSANVPAAAVPAPSVRSGDAARLALLAEHMEAKDQLPDLISRLAVLTRPALSWQRADFEYSDDAAPGLRRVQITVPSTTDYPALRVAIHRALREMPSLAMDKLSVKRQQTDQSALEVQVRFSLWVRASDANESNREALWPKR